MPIAVKHSARLILVLSGLLVLAGCSRALLTAPLSEESPKQAIAPPPTGDGAPPPPSRLTVSSGLVSHLPLVNGVLAWVDICDAFVRKDEVKLVSASHYELQFEMGSLTRDTTITMKEYDPNVLDVQFGPHGIKFPVSVVLSIDFKGTAADPGSATYNRSEPVLYWLNDRTNQWEVVPGGHTDWANKKYIVPLQHFSRYVLGGKAGWKHEPPPRGE